MTEEATLIGGYKLYSEINHAGGRVYWSDHIGGGVVVWDTCLVEGSTLLAALFCEARHQYEESMKRRGEKKHD